MTREHAVTIVLLAGGRATRLPGKLFRPVGDEALVVRVFRQLTRSGRPCIVSVREPLPQELARHLPAPSVIDTYDDAGPLGGLASAAKQVQTPLLFAAAGDLANIGPEVIDALERRYREEAARGCAPDAVLPRHENGDLEPLAALYDSAWLRLTSARLLALGQKKVTGMLEGSRVAYLQIKAADAATFHNVNSADDLAGIRIP